MLKKIRNNKLLQGCIGALGIYIVPSLILADYLIAGIVSFVFMIAGILTLRRWGPKAWSIVFYGERAQKDEHPASHLGALGTAVLALGATYQGLYGVLWIWAGQPDAWSGTPLSAFGRYLMAWGFWLWAISPDIDMKDLKLPRSTFWIAVSAIIAAIMFYLGTRVEQTPHHWLLPIPAVDRPACPPDRGVWGSSNGVFHMPDSPYRARLFPVRCFVDEREARAAGYRPHL